MGFQFSLASVLRHRAMVEEKEERLLQHIALQLTQTVEQLENTNRAIRERYASMGQAGGEASIGHAIQAAYGEVYALTEMRKELEGSIEKLEQLRNKQRLVYESARRDREVLSEMHQQARSAYDVEQARREQRMLDDLHMARRTR